MCRPPKAGRSTAGSPLGAAKHHDTWPQPADREATGRLVRPAADMKLMSVRVGIIGVGATELVGYPYWGRFGGALIALGMLVPGIYAVHTNRRSFIGSSILATIVAATNIVMMIRGETGNPLVEGAFFVFYAFITVSLSVEILRTRDFMADTLSGAVSV